MANTTQLSINDAFQSIEDMPLYNFFQYRKTQDLNWFLASYSGKETKLDAALLKPIEEKINEEYYQATNDRSFQSMIQRFAKINSLQVKHYVVSKLIEVMCEGFGPDEAQQLIRYRFIEELKLHGFKMEFMASPEEDLIALQSISSQLQGIKTKIKILEQEMKTEGSKESVSLQKQLLIVGMSLGMNYKIDAKTTTVMEWVEMTKMLEEKSKNN